MRTVNYEALAASAPLNRDAAVAMNGRGVGRPKGPVYPPGYIRSDIPLPMRPIEKTHLANASFEDLTGRRVGRLVVQGLYAVSNGKTGRWVVRCDCGQYEVRVAGPLKDLNAPRDAMCCFECDHVESLKRSATEIAAGRGKPTEWVLAERRVQAEFDAAKNAIVKAALALDEASAITGDPEALLEFRTVCFNYRALVSNRKDGSSQRETPSSAANPAATSRTGTPER